MARAIEIGFRIFYAIIGWMFIYPWAVFFPRDEKQIVVIGREGGLFLDNAKYFFLEGERILDDSITITYVTEYKEVSDLLFKTSYSCVIYPSLRSFWILLRCGSVIVDSDDWHLRFKRYLLINVKIFQIWHGVGFKRICIDKWRHKNTRRTRGSLNLLDKLSYGLRVLAGSYIRYDAINSTSNFYKENVFKKAFRGIDFPIIGFPRNTFGEINGISKKIIELNTDVEIMNHIDDWQREGIRIVIVAPTFRDSGRSAVNLDIQTVKLLNDFCRTNDVRFVFKLHPYDKSTRISSSEYIYYYDRRADIYPLLPHCHALITDYSSIYIDFLFINRPIVFFKNDIDTYNAIDRDIQFDYDIMTPGPKISSWEDIPQCLIQQWDNDPFLERRLEIRNLAFDQNDPHQATKEIISYMRSKGWIPEPQSIQSEIT